jgi:hypothetical protein
MRGRVFGFSRCYYFWSRARSSDVGEDKVLMSNGSSVTTRILLALNVMGAALYLWWASHAWVNPIERAKGLHSITGEPYVWAIGVFPIWAVFLLLNAIWGVLILRWRQWGRGRLWLLVVPIWHIAVVIDFAHH